MANIYVKAIFGGSSSLGQIQPVVGMVTDFGTVMDISGSLINIGSGTSESQRWVYDYELSILSGNVQNSRYAWPTGVTCTVFDRGTIFPNGFPINLNAGTGITYWNGTEKVLVTRG